MNQTAVEKKETGIERSINNLLTLLQEAQSGKRILELVIRRMIDLEDCYRLDSPEAVLDHLNENACTYIILIFLDVMYSPVAITEEELVAMKQNGELEDFITANWKEGTRAVAVP